MTFFASAERMKEGTRTGPGPGSHNVCTTRQVTSQCAPFGSALPRSKTARLKQNSPGPATYNLLDVAKPAQVEFHNKIVKIRGQQEHQATFKSRISRFALDPPTSTPGPGSYAPSPWRSQHKSTTVRKQRQQRHRQQLYPQRVVAPSIPNGVGKGYKYLMGKLVKIDQADIKDKLGPGAYQICQEPTHTSIINWSNSSVQHRPERKGNFNNLLQQYMGPGRYNPDQYLESKAVSSSFVSKAKRGYEMDCSTKIPGPGHYESYEPRYFDQDKHFGSKSSRFRTASSDNLIPGPGDYFRSQEIPLTSNNHQAPTTTNKRSISRQQTVSPGPGSYEVSASLYRNKTTATLSQSSKRCQLFSTSITPGPGQYNPVSRRPTFMKSLKPSTSQHHKEDVVICPSKLYQVDNYTIAHKLKMKSYQNLQTNYHRPFNSSSERFKNKQQTRTSQMKGTQVPPKQGLKTSDTRQKVNSRVSFNISSEKYRVGKQRCPSPGRYCIDKDWLKNTFNSKVLESIPL